MYTTTEVAKMLKVHKNTIMRWIEGGKIKAFKIGRFWRIKEEDLQKFIEGGK